MGWAKGHRQTDRQGRTENEVFPCDRNVRHAYTPGADRDLSLLVWSPVDRGPWTVGQMVTCGEGRQGNIEKKKKREKKIIPWPWSLLRVGVLFFFFWVCGFLFLPFQCTMCCSTSCPFLSFFNFFITYHLCPGFLRGGQQKKNYTLQSTLGPGRRQQPCRCFGVAGPIRRAPDSFRPAFNQSTVEASGVEI